MTEPYWQSDGLTVYCGNALDALWEMEPESVHCIVTSMPYFGLRSYPVDPVDWPSGYYTPMAGLAEVKVDAWHGSLGLEPTPQMYIAHLVLIWRQLWRVLRSDGTCFVVIGDSYNSGTQFNHHSSGLGNADRYAEDTQRGNWPGHREMVSNLKPKDLMGIPWRLAFALQADGWTLRSDIIWHKPNCMPESVKDRLTKSHEYIFLLSKSSRYFFDAHAIREPYSEKGLNDAIHGYGYGQNSKMHHATLDGLHGADGLNDPSVTRDKFYQHGGRNKRTVWTIPTRGSPGAHFAVFPERIPEFAIKAGSSQRGCCPKCGKGWQRVIKRTYHINAREPAHVPGNSATKVDSTGWAPTTRATDRWKPTCDCYDELINVYEMPDGKWAAAAQCVISEPFDTQELAERWALEQMATIPATILDPFLGSGVTLKVAARLRRNGIGIELSETYAAMAVEQLRKPLQVELF